MPSAWYTKTVTIARCFIFGALFIDSSSWISSRRKLLETRLLYGRLEQVHGQGVECHVPTRIFLDYYDEQRKSGIVRQFGRNMITDKIDIFVMRYSPPFFDNMTICTMKSRFSLPCPYVGISNSLMDRDCIQCLSCRQYSSTPASVKKPLQLCLVWCSEYFCADPSHHSAIKQYYDDVFSAIHLAANNCISLKRFNWCEFSVPGWNEFVQDKHELSRQAFMDWVAVGKPHDGLEVTLVRKTRAAFKLALRYCRQHEDQLRADSCTNNLDTKDSRKFWENV